MPCGSWLSLPKPIWIASRPGSSPPWNGRFGRRPAEDAEVALRYFRALRSLRVGTLTLAHVSSGEHGSDKPFGSVFWHNSARQTWYLERVERRPQDILTIGCFEDQPRTAGIPPLGCRCRSTRPARAPARLSYGDALQDVAHSARAEPCRRTAPRRRCW